MHYKTFIITYSYPQRISPTKWRESFDFDFFMTRYQEIIIKQSDGRYRRSCITELGITLVILSIIFGKR